MMPLANRRGGRTMFGGARALLLATALTSQLLSGCLGAAAYVAYPGDYEIPNPEIFSFEDRSVSRAIDYFDQHLPAADRIESEGERTTFHYDDLGLLFGGPVAFVSIGYPLGLYVPIPMGHQKLSLTFEGGMLVSARKTEAKARGFLFLYYPFLNRATSLEEFTPSAVVEEFMIRPGKDVAGKASQ
jgi:hypothetical protein